MTMDQEYQVNDLNVLLVSTYELGHQPFGLASPARWVRALSVPDLTISVQCLDLAVEPLNEALVRDADLVAFYVPMHTATRLAVSAARRVTELNPTAELCFYGLYAPMNEQYLRGLGGDTILGGEFEEGLTALVLRLADRAVAATGAGSPGPQPPQQPAGGQSLPVISLTRQRFQVPDRAQLPDLDRYAHLIDASGRKRTVGYTEATRGCKHTCRHCPIVPVYGGRFRIVQRDVVLADIENLVSGGAEHITFGDPDFFNGPAHATAIVTALHERFPEVTYDVTIKVEHLVKHARYVPTLAVTGCVLITCAVESFDDRVLTILDKQHSMADFVRALESLRSAGIAMNPTFVAFTPYSGLDAYVAFLQTVRDLDLVSSVAPVQYAIRLLLPTGSLLLDLPETQDVLDGFDEDALCYRWSHPDPRMDELQQELSGFVQRAQAESATRAEIFSGVFQLALRAAGREAEFVPLEASVDAQVVPQLDEPWYCCAEPTENQLAFLETKS
jgi:radical SAM superfamily enzyme YgiQ (UPF0313 family)